MQEFTYTITDSEGIHARPAGMLIKCAQGCSSNISILHNGRKADAKRLFAVMSLCAKQNDTITFNVEGEDEHADCAKIKTFCQKNL